MSQNYENQSFTTSESHTSGEQWLVESNMRAEKMGSLSFWQNEYEKQFLKIKTCPLCGKVCKDQWKMEYKHKHSNECLKIQAENKGETYIPPSKRKVKCECGESVLFCNFPTHLESDKHKNKMKQDVLQCKICSKIFVGKRPRRDYEAHIKTGKHKKNLEISKIRSFEKLKQKTPTR